MTTDLTDRGAELTQKESGCLYFGLFLGAAFMSYAAGYRQDVVLFGMLSTASWLFLVRCSKPLYFWRWAALTFIVYATFGLLSGQMVAVAVGLLGMVIIRRWKLGAKRGGRLLDRPEQSSVAARAASE